MVGLVVMVKVADHRVQAFVVVVHHRQRNPRNQALEVAVPHVQTVFHVHQGLLVAVPHVLIVGL